MAGLSPKRQRFVDEYLIDSNGTQAAIRAGYSPKTANEQAARMLAEVSIQAAVTAGRAAIAERNAVSQDRIRQELAKVAFGDPAQLYDPDGNLRSIHEMTPEVRASLSGVETATERNGKGESAAVTHVRKVKRWDKVRALELLGKDLGMFGDALIAQQLAELEKAVARLGISVEPAPLNGYGPRVLGKAGQ
jgi:phage terminase small subunit